MKNFLKNEKLWCVVAGAAAVIVGKKVFTSPKTRSVAVTGLAKGMKLQKDAKAKFQSMKTMRQIFATMQRQKPALKQKLKQKLKNNEIFYCI